MRRCSVRLSILTILPLLLGPLAFGAPAQGAPAAQDAAGAKILRFHYVTGYITTVPSMGWPGWTTLLTVDFAPHPDAPAA